MKYCYRPLKVALMPHDILGLTEMVFEKFSLSCAVRGCRVEKNIYNPTKEYQEKQNLFYAQVPLSQQC